ncbi:hypothetical protein [Ferruginibacter profundus]
MISRTITFLSLCFALYACSFHRNEAINDFFEKGSGLGDTSKLSFIFLSDPLAYKENIQNIVIAIADNNRLDGPVVGYGGIRSDQYKRYEMLAKYATDSSLINLTNHKNPVVRVYAFDALIKRNYWALRLVFWEHAKDNEKLQALQGCIGYYTTVSESMTSALEYYEHQKKSGKRK